MNFNYKSNNGQMITADVRVYTGDMYGDGNYLCTARTLYQSLKDVWSGDEAVTHENVDFEGQTTGIDEYIDPENYTSYQAYKSAIDNLLDPSFTSTSHL